MGPSLASSVTTWASREGKGVAWFWFLVLSQWAGLSWGCCSHHVLLLKQLFKHLRAVSGAFQTAALYVNRPPLQQINFAFLRRALQ